MRRVTDHLVLLPGLDGTGKLFSAFLEVQPARFSVDVMTYPADAVSFDELEARLRSELPEGRPSWLVAESFSGPLAVSLAACGIPDLLGLVFVCSFVRCPRPFWLRVLPWRLLCRLPAPALGLRWAMTGLGAEKSLVGEVREVRRELEPATVVGRLESATAVDESRNLALCAVPALYLRGHRDRIVLRRSADHISGLKPDTEVTVLDAPHLLLQSVPVAAWAAIASFIDAHRPGV